MPSTNTTQERPSQERCSECHTPNACVDACLEKYIRQRIWQTAEECAKLCEEQWFIDGSRTAQEFAAAIRAKFGAKQ